MARTGTPTGQVVITSINSSSEQLEKSAMERSRFFLQKRRDHDILPATERARAAHHRRRLDAPPKAERSKVPARDIDEHVGIDERPIFCRRDFLASFSSLSRRTLRCRCPFAPFPNAAERSLHAVEHICQTARQANMGERTAEIGGRPEEATLEQFDGMFWGLLNRLELVFGNKVRGVWKLNLPVSGACPG
jgi:hypothetical protein